MWQKRRGHNMPLRCSHLNLRLSNLVWWLVSLVWWLNSLICWQFCLVWWLNSPLFINTIERDVFRSQQENGVVVGNTIPLEGRFLLFKTGLKKGQTAITIGNILWMDSSLPLSIERRRLGEDGVSRSFEWRERECERDLRFRCGGIVFGLQIS